VPVGHPGRARRHAAARDVARETLGRHFAIAVHEHAQRLSAVVFEDQGLHHHMFVHAEMRGGSARAPARFPRIEVRRELHGMFAQHAHGHGDRMVGDRGCLPTYGWCE
jgi:hypothetical protein